MRYLLLHIIDGWLIQRIVAHAGWCLFTRCKFYWIKQHGSNSVNRIVKLEKTVSVLEAIRKQNEKNQSGIETKKDLDDVELSEVIWTDLD